MTRMPRAIFYPKPALPEPWTWASSPIKISCGGCSEPIPQDEMHLYHEQEQGHLHLGCGIRRLIAEGVAAAVPPEPQWDIVEDIAAFPVSARTELRIARVSRLARRSGRAWHFARLTTYRETDTGEQEPDGHRQYVPVDVAQAVIDALVAVMDRVPGGAPFHYPHGRPPRPATEIQRVPLADTDILTEEWAETQRGIVKPY